MDLSYCYANARVKGMKSKLFSESKLRELLDVKSIAELVELLEESGSYREAFVSASTKYTGMELIARALKDSDEKAKPTPDKQTAIKRVKDSFEKGL